MRCNSWFRSVLCLLVFSVSAAVGGVPLRVTNQGLLLDGSGQRVNGTVSLSVKLFDAESGGSEVYSETIGSTAVSNGVYSFAFGTNELVDVLSTNAECWVEVSIDGTPLSPRHALQSVPYALVAKEVETVQPTVPTGCMMMWSTDTAPSGWLLCDGAPVSRTTYADLFALIGTNYGFGDGSTTFNLPDLRGRFPLGQDDMGDHAANRVTGAEADSLGQGSGAEKHTLTVGEMPSHTHNMKVWPSGGAGGNPIIPTGSTGDWAGGQWTSEATGSGQPHNNMPPYMTVNYIIKH